MHFSIVIPLYNKEKEIQDTICSVLNQTHQDFELLIIDDGSTDSSVKIVSSFNDFRIKLYEKVNGGESSARNFGIKHSKYEYIAFLDSDDLWSNTFLERIKDLIENYPSCGMYSTLYNYLCESTIISPNFNISEKSNHILIENYYHSAMFAPIITSSTAVIPKKVFNDVGLFNESISHGPDLEMWLRISYKYALAVFTEPLAFYRLSASNRVCNSVPIYSKSIISLIDSLETNSNKPYYLKYLNKIRLDFMSQYLDANQVLEFKKIRRGLNVYSYKSFSYKYIPYSILLKITKWHRKIR